MNDHIIETYSEHVVLTREDDYFRPDIMNQDHPMSGIVCYRQTGYGQAEAHYWNGGAWCKLPTDKITVSLTFEADEALRWAIKRSQQEQKLEELGRKYPIIQELQEQLAVAVALVNEHENKNNS